MQPGFKGSLILILDYHVQVKVLKNNYDGSECGSLLQCINNTLTVFGSRLLRHWVWSILDPAMFSIRFGFPSPSATYAY